MKKQAFVKLLGESAASVGKTFKLPAVPSNTIAAQVLLIGQPQQNLFGTLNKLFGGLNELDGILFRSFECTFVYGEEKKFFVEIDGTETETTEESLMQMLTITNSKNLVHCKFVTNWPVLQKIQLSVLASGYDYEDLDWTHILTNYDFYFFALTSTALLSGCERKILNETLFPNAMDVLALVLLNSNWILEKDMGDIDDKLKNFVTDDVSIYFMPDADEEKLSAQLKLQAEKIPSLRDKRQARIEKIFLEKALTEINLQIESLNLSSEALDRLIDELTKKSKELPKRQELIYRRTRTAYTIKAKMDAMENISDFYQQILEKIRSEIQQGEDVDKMRLVLPNYIRDLWDEEAKQVQSEIYKSLKALENDLEGLIEKNLREFLRNDDEIAQSIDFDIAVVIAETMHKIKESAMTPPSTFDVIYPNKFNSEAIPFEATQVEESSNLKRYGVIAAGVTLALFSHPIVGAAVAIFGSRSVKKDQEAAFLAESRDALLEAAKNMNAALYDEANRWINEGMTQLEQKVSDCISACCQNVMEILIKTLTDKKNDNSDYARQLETLNDLKRQIENALSNPIKEV